MDIICIDGSFTQEKLNFFGLHGVTVPEQDKLYTVRDVIINSNGKTGLLLEELVNPKVPIKHPLFPGEVVYLEPNFDQNRFRTLMGGELNIRNSQIKKTIKTEK